MCCIEILSFWFACSISGIIVFFSLKQFFSKAAYNILFTSYWSLQNQILRNTKTSSFDVGYSVLQVHDLWRPKLIFLQSGSWNYVNPFQSPASIWSSVMLATLSLELYLDRHKIVKIFPFCLRFAIEHSLSETALKHLLWLFFL
jgi:hypothetical protein